MPAEFAVLPIVKVRPPGMFALTIVCSAPMLVCKSAFATEVCDSALSIQFASCGTVVCVLSSALTVPTFAAAIRSLILIRALARP